MSNKLIIVIIVAAITLGLAGFLIFRNNKQNNTQSAAETKNATISNQSQNSDNFNKTAAINKEVEIIFFHHSTGENIWNGGVADWFTDYNQKNNTAYQISEQNFPKDSPYGWENYPYDYWNIWVNHAGNNYFKEEPTLEILTEQYDLIIFKHCFPVSDIEENTGSPDISSPKKTLENYKLQYRALKDKMREFPNNKFLVWTGAAQVAGEISEENAARAKEFFDWVKNEWDEKNDNIYIWDFYALETEGQLYIKNEYAAGPDDSHPNITFSRKIAPYYGQRIVDIIENRGDNTSITGK